MIINNNKTLTLIDRGKTITENLLYQVELIHTAANNQISQDHKNQKGQFLTPLSIASLMANMFDFSLSEISLLDAGAGAGALLTTVVAELCQLQKKPKSLHITAYEIDPILINFLEKI